MRIVLVEDHDRLAQAIVKGLDEFGFRVDPFATAEDGISATKCTEYNALILDLGL
jgi:DNA-binding response OmpR family regulator